MKIYNSKLLNNNARFNQAVIAGVLATIGMSVVYVFIARLLNSVSAVLFLLNGFVIANVIKNQGRGVGHKFGYLGLGLTIASILLSQLFLYYGFTVLLNPMLLLSGSLNVIANLISLNNPLSLLMNILFIGYACQYAYHNSTIL
ncbi:MAG: hypothetical protein ACRCZJ_03205 [Erysipelotrichaceae bacterium]